MMRLHPDWREFVELLNSHEVEYIIVGAYARALHGVPRSTGDIDLFVRPTAENAARMQRAIAAFGFGSLGITAEDFQISGRVIQLGVEPYRIDLITSISGLSFDEAWSDRVRGELDGLPVAFLSLRALKKNKIAAGRPKDLADLADLPE
ncbi:MAG: DUF6036 family nucleotidyltransferase [Bryobacteraceae bacterium]